MTTSRLDSYLIKVLRKFKRTDNIIQNACGNAYEMGFNAGLVEGSKINGKKYAMNICGTIVKRDITPGFIYYTDDDGSFHREKPFYHPDQRLNISQIYSEEAANLWKNNFEP